jgi:hypothetical protein
MQELLAGLCLDSLASGHDQRTQLGIVEVVVDAPVIAGFVDVQWLAVGRRD